MTRIRTLTIALTCTLTGLISCGTLGGFESRTFSTSKQNLVNSIDTLYKNHPEYKIPDKWNPFDDWKERGYNFLDSRIFYFKSEPEEMYYVTFLGDQNDSIQVNSQSTRISIRAINKGTGHWQLENETSNSEKERINNRFENEIVSKLENYINSKSTKD